MQRQDQAKKHYPEAGMDFRDIPPLVSQHGPHQTPVVIWELLAQLVQVILCRDPHRLLQRVSPAGNI